MPRMQVEQNEGAAGARVRPVRFAAAFCFATRALAGSLLRYEYSRAVYGRREGDADACQEQMKGRNQQ